LKRTNHRSIIALGRFGDSIEREANVRVIFGTNQDLQFLIRERLFLPDLYERMAGEEYSIPPLRKRKEDIALLAEKFLNELNNSKEKAMKIHEDGFTLLSNFPWPGNIRQLRHYIESRYNDACMNNLHSISVAAMKATPPRDALYQKESDVAVLRKIFTKIMLEWNPENGSLLEAYIYPLLTHIYSDDLALKKDDAYSHLGIEGTRGNSKFNQYYNAYEEFRRKFSE
jgi:DNA-binding NtrC family response regulator